MPSPTLYYIRHGLTDWNAELRFQGQRDIPLNDVGRFQARKNGERLKTLEKSFASFDFVASPLGRTCETMEIVRENLGLPRSGYRTEASLVEMSYGDLEGTTLDELEIEQPDIYNGRLENRWDFQPPKGESLEMTMQRVIPFFNSIERDTVVVAHGAVGRTVRKFLLGLEAEDAAWFEFPQDQVFKIVDGKEEVF